MATGSSLLLADDSITIQKVINLTFADEGMNVTTVGNGDLALAKIEELSPDIVMLDVHMPGLNGYEICERLKQSEKFRDIPVILLVGSFEPFDEEEARRVGADDFLTKPFQSIRQLISKVGALLHDRPTRGLDEPQAPVVDGDDPAVEYEVAPGQEFTGARNAVGISSAATTRLEPHEALPDTWTGHHSDYATDAGLDDELIEARPVTGDVVQPDTYTGGSRVTRPLSALEADELAQVGFAPDTGSIAGAQTVPPPEAGVQTMPPAESVDDPILELGEIDGHRGVVNGEEAVLDLGEAEAEAAAEAAAAAEADGFARFDIVKDDAADAVIADSTAAVPESADTTTPADTGHAYAAPEPTPHVTLGSDSTGETEAAATFSAGQLSPEIIDAIAHRVVELISDRAVREIAWEVVPQLADLHIKRKLEEQK